MQPKYNQTQKNIFQISSHTFADLSASQHPLPFNLQESSHRQSEENLANDQENAESEQEASQSITEGKMVEAESGNSYRTEQEELLKLQKQLEEIERQETQRLKHANRPCEDSNHDNPDRKSKGSSRVCEEGGLNHPHSLNFQCQRRVKLSILQEHENDKELTSNDNSQNSPKEDTAVTCGSSPIEPKEQILQGIIQEPKFLSNQPLQSQNDQNSEPFEAILEQKPRTSEQNVKNYLDQSNESIPSESSKVSLKKQRKVFEELTEEQVLDVTEKLEKILNLLKNKLPNCQQIEIIRALYTKYVGPEEEQKPKLQRKAPPKHINKEGCKHRPEETSSLMTNRNSRFPDHQIPEDQKLLNRNPSLMNLGLQKQKSPSKPTPPTYSHQVIPQKRPYTKRGGQSGQRFMQQQRVAKLFIKKGYGLQVARQHLGSNIENNYYTNLITTIIRETWRKIEDFIGKFRKINTMDNNAFKIIKTSLVNCVKWMDSSDLMTFYQFMKVLYQMDSRMPYEDQAIRFYNNCIRRYEDLKKPFETQYKIRQEKKVVQKLRAGDTSSFSGNPITPTINRTSYQPRPSKMLPSDRELQDLTSLIKSQLRHPPQMQRSFVLPPQQPRPVQHQPPHPMMRPPIPQNIIYPRSMPHQMNGQRF